jgi:pimeloyl-ACP methyl ester carboxylesterase
LRYADWGGTGPWLVFLTPAGGSLDEQFGILAPQFVDRFRVVGLTRRGQPPSAVPAGVLRQNLVTIVGARSVATGEALRRVWR